MNGQLPSTGRTPPQRSRVGAIVGLAVLVALVAIGLSIYGLVKQSLNASLEAQLPYLIAAGGGMTIAAIIAMIRSMSVFDILEAMLDAVFLLFAMIGAVLKGIWNAILGLFGWD